MMLMMRSFFLIFGIFSLSKITAQQVILSESFDQGIPASWSIIDGDNFVVNSSVVEFQPAWIGLDDPFVAGNKIAGSTSYFEPEGKAYRFLVTPQITLGDYGNFLSWQSMSHDPSFPDWIMVLISTSGNEIGDFTDTLFRLNNEFPVWTERSINLSLEGYDDSTVYLAFVNHTNQGFKLYLDSVKVEVNNPVSIESNTISNIVVYPNPTTNGILSVQSDEEILSLDILDFSGRVVKQCLNPGKTISVSDLSNGMYFIVALTASGEKTLRFQKQG